MFKNCVASVLFLSVVSSSAWAVSFKKGDVLYCEKDGIQATFTSDVGARGATVLLDVGDNAVRHTNADMNGSGNMLLMSASDCPDENQCWEITLNVRSGDIRKNEAIRVLMGTKFNKAKMKYSTITCVVK